MVPTVTSFDEEPVLPGFERIARNAGRAADRVLSLDLEVSPINQSLVDDNGGEWS